MPPFSAPLSTPTVMFFLFFSFFSGRHCRRIWHFAPRFWTWMVEISTAGRIACGWRRGWASRPRKSSTSPRTKSSRCFQKSAAYLLLYTNTHCITHAFYVYGNYNICSPYCIYTTEFMVNHSDALDARVYVYMYVRDRWFEQHGLSTTTRN